MSIRQMNAAWEAECRSHTAKLVLIALSDNANDSGVCWPSITNIAKRCGLSRQSVLDQIEHLEADKMISVDRAGKGKSNRYSLTIPVNAIDQSTRLTSQPDRLPLVNVVDHHQSTPLTEVVNVVDPNHKEPLIEPIIEPSRSKSKKIKLSAPSSDGIEFAEWFKTLIPPSVKLSSNWLEQWAKAYDDSIRIDGRTPEQIRAVCAWARNDNFWSSNFMSPMKLRSKDKSQVQYFDVFASKMPKMAAPVVQLDPEQQAERDEFRGRLSALFNRTSDDVWSAEEEKAFAFTSYPPEPSMLALEKYYKYRRFPDGKDYRKKKLLNLLLDFTGELDVARNWKEPSCIR